MLLSGPPRRDPETVERLRSVWERMEATVSGLGELEYLRQRQEGLVRAALEEQGVRGGAPLSSEEKLLEENILLLRKQLSCLRRRDAGLISQLQELDQQISDLRLDSETAHYSLETDSRPSSGFYELSDGASGSLSNSSNSVFSESFCTTADADRRLPSTDELSGCLECDGVFGGLCDDPSSFATVRRSLSAPHPPTMDAASSVVSCDAQSKYHCDLVARNGSDVYRYPSPLHAVAVQSPAFLQMLGHRGHGTDEAGSGSAALVPLSSSWPASSSSSSQIASHKRLDSYIYGLLQRRAQPIRTSRPRTSINTDPSKSVLRQASLCVRQLSGPSCGSGSGSGVGTLRTSELKPSWSVGGASAEGAAATASPHRKWSMESKGEEQEMQNVFPSGTDVTPSGDSNSPRGYGVQSSGSVTNKDPNTSTNSLLRKQNKGLPHAADLREVGSPKANSCPKDTKQPCCHPDQELLLNPPPVIKMPQNSPAPLQTGPPEEADQSVSELASAGSSSHSHNERQESHMVSARCPPTQRHSARLCKGGGKTGKMRSAKTTKTSQASEDGEPPSERRAEKSPYSWKMPRLLEGGGSTHIKVSKREASSRMKRLPASIPEGRVPDKHATSGASKRHHHGNHHHHRRDQVVVVAKPKYKRNEYRRLRAMMEVPYDEAVRRAQRRQRKELLSNSTANVYATSRGQLNNPDTYVAGSDSEYSAECASLFHSTIVDTSEDERSNYTMNRFGDSESSEDKYVEESTTTSDTEESGGGAGGVGRGRGQMGTAGQEMTPTQAKAFIKIKASHNLKKKILRFRSGSLKLMTTV